MTRQRRAVPAQQRDRIALAHPGRMPPSTDLTPLEVVHAARPPPPIAAELIDLVDDPETVGGR